jgi:hypothetical protein
MKLLSVVITSTNLYARITECKREICEITPHCSTMFITKLRLRYSAYSTEKLAEVGRIRPNSSLVIVKYSFRCIIALQMLV